MVGSALAELLARDGHTVWGIRRDTSSLPGFVRPLPGDLADPERFPEIPATADTIFFMPSSDERSEAGYRRSYVQTGRNLLRFIKNRGCDIRRLVCVSSTGVYEQQDGAWVDENTTAAPSHFSGRLLLEAEELLHSSPFPTAVVRFSGIYGPTRIRLLHRVAQGLEVCRQGPPVFTNRIHQADCAGVLRHVMGLEDPAPLYIASDDEPVERNKLLLWMAGEMNAPAPLFAPRDGGGDTFLRSNKRCSNKLIKSHGYQFQYPSYREGYTPIIKQVRNG